MKEICATCKFRDPKFTSKRQDGRTNCIKINLNIFKWLSTRSSNETLVQWKMGEYQESGSIYFPPDYGCVNWEGK